MEIDQVLQGRLATLRMIPPTASSGGAEFEEMPFVDLLFASSGIEPEVVATAEPVEVLTGIEVPTARVPHLIAMKILSECDERMKDRDDLGKLLLAADTREIEEAQALLRLIDERGFSRGKDLSKTLQGFISE